MDTERLEEYKRRFMEIHNERLALHGSYVCSVWNSEHSQRQRFNMLLGIGLLEGASVLDVGCGLGDLYGYLEYLGLDCQYLGVDINPQMVERASQKYPRGQFRCLDILSDPLDTQFDYALASGIFFVPFSTRQEWDEYLVMMASCMFSLVRKGVSFNCLSSLSETPDDASFYAAPWHVLELIQTISKWTVLRHDYRMNDFTVHIYHHPLIP